MFWIIFHSLIPIEPCYSRGTLEMKDAMITAQMTLGYSAWKFPRSVQQRLGVINVGSQCGVSLWFCCPGGDNTAQCYRHSRGWYNGQLVDIHHTIHIVTQQLTSQNNTAHYIKSILNRNNLLERHCVSTYRQTRLFIQKTFQANKHITKKTSRIRITGHLGREYFESKCYNYLLIVVRRFIANRTTVHVSLANQALILCKASSTWPESPWSWTASVHIRHLEKFNNFPVIQKVLFERGTGDGVVVQ